MNIKKTMAAVALVAGVIVQSPVYAGPLGLADANLRLTNFRFIDGDNNIITQGDQVQGVAGTNSGNAFASLQPGGFSNPPGQNSPAGAGLETWACVGNCVSNHDYTTLGSDHFSSNSNDGAFAGARLQDSAIAGLNAPTGANAETRATIGLTNATIGDAGSNIGLLAQFEFTATDDFQLGFATDYAVTAYAMLDALAGQNVSAQGVQASTAWNMTLTETASGDLVDVISPTEFNRTFAALAPGETQGIQNAMGNVSYFFGPDLVAGTTYTLNLRHNTDADVLLQPTDIPEPTLLALLGVGLLGMMVSMRGRRTTMVV